MPRKTHTHIHFKNKKISNSHKEKISFSLKNKYCGDKNISSKKVQQFDLNGKLLNTFGSIREAARFLGNENLNIHISEACRGKRKTVKEYIWRYMLD